jgi:hypothetical protein
MPGLDSGGTLALRAAYNSSATGMSRQCEASSCFFQRLTCRAWNL